MDCERIFEPPDDDQFSDLESKEAILRNLLYSLEITPNIQTILFDFFIIFDTPESCCNALPYGRGFIDKYDHESLYGSLNEIHGFFQNKDLTSIYNAFPYVEELVKTNNLASVCDIFQYIGEKFKNIEEDNQILLPNCHLFLLIFCRHMSLEFPNSYLIFNLINSFYVLCSQPHFFNQKHMYLAISSLFSK